MNITADGVELDSEELIRFFEDYSETSSIITLYDAHGFIMGDVVAISDDNRMVLDVDIPARGNLFSDTYCNVRVVIENSRKFKLTILN